MHVVPPLRSGADRLALIEGVASGVIDAICSDHQPHERDAKLAPLPSTEPGRADLPGLLRQSLKLVSEGYVPLERMIDALSAAPNRILGLKPLDRPDLLVDLAAP
jgi:dihydroorotase